MLHEVLETEEDDIHCPHSQSTVLLFLPEDRNHPTYEIEP